MFMHKLGCYLHFYFILDQQAVWCYDVLQITETDLIQELLIELNRI